MGTLSKAIRPGLYAITDSLLTPGPELLVYVEAAILGGAVLVQYRDKSATGPERLRRAQNLQALCRDARVPLIINDDAELARRVGAAGVHLGQSDGSVAEARNLLGETAIIGVTCHSDLALARAAAEQSADYLAFGRFFGSTTKPDAPAADPAVLRHGREFGLPVTAIGGITLDNGEPLIRAGADMLAVVGGLFGDSPEHSKQRAQGFARLFRQHHSFFQNPDNRNPAP